MFKSVYYALLLSLVCILPSCLTSRVESLETDLFRAQTKILELQGQIGDKEKQIIDQEVNTSTKLASSTQQMTKIEDSIQRLSGEMDLIKEGVRLGRLPDQPEEESLSYRIQQFQEQLSVLKNSQQELLKMIEEQILSKQANTPKKSQINTLAQLQRAFRQKRYTHVVVNAEALVRAQKGKNKLLVQYLHAESLFRLGNLQEAALQFNKILTSNSLKDKWSHMRLRMGDCLRLLGDKAAAKVYYREVLAEFPKTDAAEKARKYVARLDPKAGNRL